MVHTEIQLPLVRLTVGPRRCRPYIVACLKQPRNYNGTGVVRRIVMARFKNMTIIMAQIQLTLMSMYLSSFKCNTWLHELAEVGGDDLGLFA